MVKLYLGEMLFPAAPTAMRMEGESISKTVLTQSDGEVSFCRGSKQKRVYLEGYLPALSEKNLFSCSQNSPEQCTALLESLQQLGKPVRFALSGGAYPCSFPVTVEKLTFKTEAGSEGLFYRIQLLEYRSVEQKTVFSGGTVSSVRADLRKREKTVVHRVVKGDTLWGIAKRYLGSGSRYLELAKLNGISNPNLIFVGQEVKILL